MRLSNCLFLLSFTCLSIIGLAQNFDFIQYDSHTNSSFRALSVIDDNNAWVSGSKGWFGRTRDAGKTWEFDQIKQFQEMDFRTLYAFDELNAVIINAGAPTYILRTCNGGENWLPVYMNADEEMFIDGIDFWNEKDGVIYGDPINGKMTILKTNDGGYTWQDLPEPNRPKMADGEASFAASGSGIRCVAPSTIFITSGGKKSRLFYSSTKGMSWNIIDVPIIQGSSSEGIYSIAVQNTNLVVVGGDFTKENNTVDHVFVSTNMGKKWNSPKTPTNGYRESVEYISDQFLISTGPNGTDTSNDGGITWSNLRAAEGMHVVRKSRNGNLIIIAGKDGKLLIGTQH